MAALVRGEGSNVRWVAHLDAIIPLRRPKTRPMIPQSEGNMTVHSKTARHRILFVIGSMGRGGAERVISILANEYAERGSEVRILTLLDDEIGYALKEGVEVVPLCDKNKSRIRQLPFWLYQIRRAVRIYQPDVVVSFIARINIVTLLSCLGMKQRIVVSERNDPARDGRSPLVRLATRLLYPFAALVVFQTAWAQACFPRRLWKRSAIIPNPISVSTGALQVKSKKIVSVGRLVEQKNHKLLIKAFKVVHESHPEYSLFIYGDGPLRTELVKQVDALGIAHAVFLPGVVPDVHEKIADAEMFVLSSDYEGLSNALLEAMMMGLPCISTYCAGSDEVIVDGENGLLVPVGNHVALAEAMIKMIESPSLARELGQRSRASASRFRKEEVIKDWNSILFER